MRALSMRLKQGLRQERCSFHVCFDGADFAKFLLVRQSGESQTLHARTLHGSPEDDRQNSG